MQNFDSEEEPPRDAEAEAEEDKRAQKWLMKPLIGCAHPTFNGSSPSCIHPTLKGAVQVESITGLRLCKVVRKPK